jgi:hypothetical protein
MHTETSSFNVSNRTPDGNLPLRLLRDKFITLKKSNKLMDAGIFCPLKLLKLRSNDFKPLIFPMMFGISPCRPLIPGVFEHEEPP